MAKKKGRANPDDRPAQGAEMTAEPTQAVKFAATRNAYVGRIKLLNPPQSIKDRKKPARPKSSF
jgi:hypothetical protein